MVTDIASALFVGAAGGLTAHFLGNTAWDYFTRPVLSADDTFDITFDYSEEGELQIAHYSVVLENTGKKPARNCSAKMYIDGQTDGIHYHYEDRLPWKNEGGNIQTTINPQQRVKLEICRIDYKENPGIVVFPADGGWDKNTVNMIAGKEGKKLKPIKEYWEGKNEVWGQGGFTERELIEGIWKQNRIVVTSENGGKLIIEPSYEYPETHSHGMEIHFESSHTSRYSNRFTDYKGTFYQVL